jgi:hypothetical protein
LALKYNNKPKTPGHLIPHRRRKQSSTKKCKTIGLLCLLVHTHTHTQDCSSSFYRIWFMATFLSIELNS